MTQTLRRELRNKFPDVIVRNGITSNEGVQSDFWKSVIEQLADAALELRAFQFKPKTIQQAVEAGLPVDEELLQAEKNKDNATKQFENALGIKKSLPWGVGKDWTEFQEWVIEIYKEDRTAFGRYNIWRSNQFASGKLSNVRIREKVTLFYDSWDMFTMSEGHKTDEARGQYEVKQVTEEEKRQLQNSIDWSKH
jgi:hypothetical protein